MENRIEYIDYIKGFSILWIVWWHTRHPAFVSPYWHVPIFFFISGTFFKKETFHGLIQKTMKYLIIPFIFFYILSYFYRIALYFWDFKEIQTFNYFSIFDLFKWEVVGDHLSVNVPLWFLVCLIMSRLLWWFILNISTNKYFIIIISILFFWLESFVTKHTILLPFMLPQVLLNSIYFGFGIVFGRKLIEIMANKKNSTILFSIATVIFLVFFWISPSTYTNLFQFYAFLIIVFFLFKHFYKLPFAKFFHFYGINSLIVLGFHVPIQIIYRRIMYRFYGDATIWTGIADTILTIITLYFVILFLNRYFPQFVGKK